MVRKILAALDAQSNKGSVIWQWKGTPHPAHVAYISWWAASEGCGQASSAPIIIGYTSQRRLSWFITNSHQPTISVCLVRKHKLFKELNTILLLSLMVKQQSSYLSPPDYRQICCLWICRLALPTSNFSPASLRQVMTCLPLVFTLQ